MVSDTSSSILSESSYSKLLSDLRKLWETGKAKAQRAVSRQLLQTYWEIGGRIADEQLTPNRIRESRYGTPGRGHADGYDDPIPVRPVPRHLQDLAGQRIPVLVPLPGAPDGQGPQRTSLLHPRDGNQALGPGPALKGRARRHLHPGQEGNQSKEASPPHRSNLRFQSHNPGSGGRRHPGSPGSGDVRAVDWRARRRNGAGACGGHRQARGLL